MKLLLLSNLISYTYNFRKEIIEAFHAQGHQVVVVCDNDDEAKRQELSQICRIINVAFDGKGTNPAQELKLLKTYSKILKQEKPNLVFTFTIKMNLYGGLVAKHHHIPYVPMITGLGELEKSGKLRAILMFLHKRVMPHAKCVIFQNADNKAFFDEHNIRYQNAAIVPGSGINLDKFTLQPYPQESPIVFAFLGRLISAKGIEEFLKCSEDLAGSSEGLQLKFKAAGKLDEQYKPTVERLVKENKLDYVGELSDTREFLKTSSVLVLPTYHPEGLSNVILEACATGRPVICTARTGCKEIVEDGVNGLYCKTKDPENLKEVLLKFSKLTVQERAQMGQKGRKLVEEKFDRKLVVEKYLSLLK